MTTYPLPDVTPLSARAKQQLSVVSVATLTTQLFKRGLKNQYVQNVALLNRKAPRMVGPAYTLRHIPAREDLDVLGAFEGRSHPQRVAIEQVPQGWVLVMDCRGDTRAASAGAILLTRAMTRGCAGVVTDGGLRDSHEIATLDFPVYCGGPSAPTNLTRHHAVDIGLPIACGEIAVFPGDIMVGDEEGVICIPHAIAEDVANLAWDMHCYEEFVIEEVRGGRGLWGLYPVEAEAKARFEAWKASGKAPKLG
jgi:regulator of RNase E activity RraA